MPDKVFSVDKFLGINEYADSETELKPGQAAMMRNFRITDGGNLALRPGVRRFVPLHDDWPYTNLREAFPMYMDGKEWLYCSFWTEGGFVVAFLREDDEDWAKFGSVDNDASGQPAYKSFEHDGKVWVCWKDENETMRADYVPFGMRVNTETYVPLLISGGDPSGGGATVEPLNILSDFFRAKYIAKDRATEYRLPSATTGVVSIVVDNKEYAASDMGTFNSQTKTFTFAANKEPQDDLDVEFTCQHSDEDIRSARRLFFEMRYYTHFNGATDTRTFFYGGGSADYGNQNICYYTGVPAHGSGLYVPAGNELAVDFSDSPITGLVRHYSRLLAFKPDGVDAITYEPVTLADGSVIASFFLRPVSRDFGNDALGQVQLVDNAARSLTKSGAYDWRVSAGNYRDERYAKRVSDAVVKTLSYADASQIVTCDDGNTKTWYAFLNNGSGTVLVHRYGLDVWFAYQSEFLDEVTSAFVFDKKVTFLKNGRLFFLDEKTAMDEDEDGDTFPIEAVWESGFQDFGAAFRRKDSDQLWVSMLPVDGASVHVSVKTDARKDYEERELSTALAPEYGDAEPNGVPFVTRLRMKIKRFVYYKLRFWVKDPGASPVILGYDQHIRFSSSVK